MCFLVLFTHSKSISQNIYDTIRTVKMTAVADHQLMHITVSWRDDVDNNTYSLYRKLREETSWGNPLITTGDQDTSYVDSDIEAGELYEYRILKHTGDSLGYAYLFSGVDYMPPQKRGDILLLVDSVAADFAEDNLTAYMNTLTSEGWIPWLEAVPTERSVADVKSLVLDYHQNVDSLSAVILMGNIAVAHSGDINPDAHSDHKGAWPADLYYGDVDGIWTDSIVDNTSSNYPRIHNIPGDGNFDQGFIPGEIELAVGRLDFSELPVFDLDEYELLDRYLEKNIEFRTAEYQPKRRAVFKNKNPWVEGLGQNAIRNFSPIVSPDSMVYFEFFDAFYDSFLWSYGGSSGSMYSSNQLGNINTYANNNFQATFTSYFGSYYGDYDFENNYLRTVLASGKVLSTAWVGAPNWYFHPMGMGLDLGFCTLLTQNNTSIYYAGVFPKSVTINLLGDPTLKAYNVAPPHNLTGIQNGNHITLSWSPSADNNLLGYQVYKKSEGMDYFEAINLIPITDTTLIDSCIVGETQIPYLVKAVKREITPSGCFINHSSGPIISIQTTPNILPEAAFNLAWSQGVLSGENLSTNADQYHWMLPDGTSVFDENFDITYNLSGEISVSLVASNNCFSDSLQQVLTISDVTNSEIDKKIYSYPNPTQNTFTLETEMRVDELYLYDVLGHCVLVESNLVAGSHIINIRNFVAGSYFLKMQVGGEVVARVILVE